MHLGILTSHPIQYQAPWFRALAKEVELEVFFAHRPDDHQQGEGFGKSLNWDVDLLSGYRHRFLKNISSPAITQPFFWMRHAGNCQDHYKSRKQKTESRNGRWQFQPSAFNIQPFPFRRLHCQWLAAQMLLAGYSGVPRAGVPVFVRGDSQLLTPRSRLLRFAKELSYRAMLKQFDGFLVVGQRNREYLAHYGVPAKECFLCRISWTMNGSGEKQKLRESRKQK